MSMVSLAWVAVATNAQPSPAPAPRRAQNDSRTLFRVPFSESDDSIYVSDIVNIRLLRLAKRFKLEAVCPAEKAE